MKISKDVSKRAQVDPFSSIKLHHELHDFRARGISNLGQNILKIYPLRTIFRYNKEKSNPATFIWHV